MDRSELRTQGESTPAVGLRHPQPSLSEEDEISVALISEVRQFSGLFSAGLGVQVENLEALRQFLEVRLAADPSQVGGVHASRVAPFLSTR